MIDVLYLLLTALALAYIGLVALAVWIAPGMIFPVPPRSALASDGETPLPCSNGKSIAVRYLENPTADRLLLYHHGNAEDLGQIEERLNWYRDRGFAVLAYDYPGYGSSEGRPTAENILDAAEAVLAHAQTDLGWPHDSIISYGRSLGGGPCLELAARYPLAGAVLEGTFTSTFRVMTRWRLLPWDIFDNLALIGRARCPVLIIHGQGDRTVPFHHGKQLLAAAPPGSEHLWIEGARHIDVVEVGGETFWAKLDAFAHRAPIDHRASV